MKFTYYVYQFCILYELVTTLKHDDIRSIYFNSCRTSEHLIDLSTNTNRSLILIRGTSTHNGQSCEIRLQNRNAHYECHAIFFCSRRLILSKSQECDKEERFLQFSTNDGISYSSICFDYDDFTHLFHLKSNDQIIIRNTQHTSIPKLEYNCAFSYKCLQNIDNKHDRKSSVGIISASDDSVIDNKLDTEFKDDDRFKMSCSTKKGSSCVSGYYIMKSSNRVYYHMVNCFPAFDDHGRNIDLNSTKNARYFCPINGENSNNPVIIHRNHHGFWNDLEECNDENPSCYTSGPLEVIYGPNITGCKTEDNMDCVERPWMDHNGNWYLGCVYMRLNEMKGWICATKTGTHGIALEYGKCKVKNQDKCLNGIHHLVKDESIKNKPWMKKFNQEFKPGPSSYMVVGG